MADGGVTHWDDQAQKFGASPEASWGDSFCISLEVETIAKHIRDGDHVLDVGCSNGHALARQMELHKITATGIDVSPLMVEAGLKGANLRCLDILNTDFKDKSFDVVYTTRTLINLRSWEEQERAIKECLRLAKRTVIFSEAFWEPLCRLNALRLVCGLPPLEEPDFNLYLKTGRMFKALSDYNFRVDDFSSVYYFGSRLLRECVTVVSKYPGYSNPVNKEFYDLAQKYKGGGFGIQMACVVTL